MQSQNRSAIWTLAIMSLFGLVVLLAIQLTQPFEYGWYLLGAWTIYSAVRLALYWKKHG